MKYSIRSCPTKPKLKKPIATIEREPGKLYAYTDGSTFKYNPGPISWGIVFVKDDSVVRIQGEDRVISGATALGTSARAELIAVVCALENECYEDLGIVTDSLSTLHYAVGNWKRKGTKDKDLWDRFDTAIKRRQAHGCTTDFFYVKGHHSDQFNKQADKLAAALAKANWALVQEEL